MKSAPTDNAEENRQANMQYYLKRGDKVKGPISHEQLMAFAKQKKLKKSDLIGNLENGSFQKLIKVWDSVKSSVPVPDVANSLAVVSNDEDWMTLDNSTKEKTSKKLNKAVTVEEVGKFKIIGNRIAFNCPYCSIPLKSYYAKGGTQDTCPECNRPFITPGHDFKAKKQRDAIKPEDLTWQDVFEWKEIKLHSEHSVLNGLVFFAAVLLLVAKSIAIGLVYAFHSIAREIETTRNEIRIKSELAKEQRAEHSIDNQNSTTKNLEDPYDYPWEQKSQAEKNEEAALVREYYRRGQRCADDIFEREHLRRTKLIKKAADKSAEANLPRNRYRVSKPDVNGIREGRCYVYLAELRQGRDYFYKIGESLNPFNRFIEELDLKQIDAVKIIATHECWGKRYARKIEKGILDATIKFHYVPKRAFGGAVKECRFRTPEVIQFFQEAAGQVILLEEEEHNEARKLWEEHYRQNFDYAEFQVYEEAPIYGEAEAERHLKAEERKKNHRKNFDDAYENWRKKINHQDS